jgi:hypothetical protein
MKPLTILEGLTLLFLAIAILLWFFYKVGENNARREKAFNELHAIIERDIKDMPPNDYNYEAIILVRLKQLESMKWNAEKVSVLRYKLNQKFEFKE